MQYQVYNRWQYRKILASLKKRRVMILSGARQVGKTTLVRYLAAQSKSGDVIYRTLDDVALLDAAKNDPHGFIAHSSELMIIDEVQRAPSLLQAIKQDVDERPIPGRFLLTGSADIQSLANVKESLAGRVGKIRLRPLSEGEKRTKLPNFIKHAFTESFESLGNKTEDYSKDQYLTLAFQGGFPEVIGLDRREVRRWHIDYLDAITERDLRDIINIRRKDHMHKLLEILAAWSSKFMDISAIGVNLSLARPTLISYINALEALFIVERVRPWFKTDYDRVSKHDKLFMTDTGMMTSILNWRMDEVRLNGEKHGKLIETFVFNQLAAILDAQADDFSLYHYRDREKREIDFVIENEAGELLGIEVKAGSAVDKRAFKHLTWFKKNMAKDQPFVGIILYTGRHVIPFGEGLWAVPLCALWE